MLNRKRPSLLPAVSPSADSSLSLPTPPRMLTRRLRTPLIALLALTTYALLYLAASPAPWAKDQNYAALPPLYEAYHAAERALPQHNPNARFPDGKDAKFFWVANHAQNQGWGNAMQEHLMNAFLAYETGRAFVFDNFTWDRDAPTPYSNYNGKPIPARIPFSTMLAGPLMGAPFPPGSPIPRSVSREYYEKVCAEEKRVVIRTETVVSEWERFDKVVGAKVLFDKWVQRLEREDTRDARCVEVDMDSALVWEIWIFGSTRILDIWPALARSQLLTHFAWSPLIHAAFRANSALLLPTPSLLGLPHLPSLPFSRFFREHNPHNPDNPNYDAHAHTPASPHASHADVPLPHDFLQTYKDTSAADAPIPGLLVLHVRKGDFEEHCSHLADWASTFNGFNAFPALPDQFAAPAGCGGGVSTAAGRAVYMARCAPGIAKMVEQVRRVRIDERARLRTLGRAAEKGAGELERVYIMTNAPAPWVEELKAAIRGMAWDLPDEAGLAPWAGVASSRDLALDAEQRYVAQAVDMLAGQRAQVFVGNGFSSLSSNIVMLRMAKGVRPPETNRFW
ncbi:hypothetical protein FIBSPDRAFT_960782 [Athelia psychrophila]|uniref:Uncharacterized protein n=1 Tax=Athelia psychrophila TaxID=1759441 RepID=A0A166C2Z6_9AGAM|nr:hypothetical protein FIBSPDRAFT_960782 [Fibularhizoctonia sp. CBS 109695]